MIFAESSFKEVIDELKLWQRLVLREQATASLFDLASKALLETCEVIHAFQTLTRSCEDLRDDFINQKLINN